MTAPPRLVITPATPMTRYTATCGEPTRRISRQLFADEDVFIAKPTLARPRSGAVSILFVLFAFVLVTTSALLSAPFTTPHLDRMSRFSDSVDTGFRRILGTHRNFSVHTPAVHKMIVDPPEPRQESWQAFLRRTTSEGQGLAGMEAWDFH